MSEVLAECFDKQPNDISKIAPASVVRFIVRRARGLAPDSIKSIGVSVRNYFLFKASGRTPAQL
ncbi:MULTISPECIES: hypothetical protein [Burkholderia]|uniref:hypothetical protein n=1 Tax=Burkholderia TaxID=32008 RepID=UPI000AF846F8|nr:MULTISPECIES: hypothetical protein [Burkholderia]